MSSAAALRVTPLNSVHRNLGAKMVDFGGWDMPVQYSGILDEHNAVRNAVGLFDVSHMGEIEIRGPEAAKLTDFATTNAVAKLNLGQAHYSGLLYDHGGFVDDILVHKVADDHFFLCVNASNQDKDYEHICSLNRFDCTVVLHGAIEAVQRADVLVILILIRRVDAEEKMIVGDLVHQDIVDEAAVIVEQTRVVRLAKVEFGDGVGGCKIGQLRGFRPADFDFAHVADVEETDRIATPV